MNFYRLIQGDCLKVLPTLEDESVDFILTDPPYGINKVGITNDESLDFYYGSLSEMYRILKKDSFFITFASVGRLPDFFKNNPFQYRWQYITYINNGMVRGNLGFSAYIISLVFQKGNAKLSKQIRDVVEISTSSKECANRVHPTQKSEVACTKLIEVFSKGDDIILDPFLGSGTTMKVAQDLGRSCIGIEINPNYCDIVKKRCFDRTFLDREIKCSFEMKI